ncbi:hypothetical protein, partial [Thermogutta sp.]|uniref:hypothetical protein n=1 Tax=Thermogutta sp. TaxID=1962930 RepID=UPI0032208886
MRTLLLLATYGLEIVECGGTLVKHARAGDSVHAAVALARPDYRDQIRRAAAILGAEVTFLDLAYGEVQADLPAKIKLVSLLRR